MYESLIKYAFDANSDKDVIIRIYHPNLSRNIQEACMAQKIFWAGEYPNIVKHTDTPFLFIRGCGTPYPVIRYGDKYRENYRTEYIEYFTGDDSFNIEEILDVKDYLLLD